MKYEYLKTVTNLFEEVDYPNQYKALIQLEKDISQYEINGDISNEQLISLFGTPQEFVDKIISQPEIDTVEESLLQLSDDERMLSEEVNVQNSANPKAHKTVKISFAIISFLYTTFSFMFLALTVVIAMAIFVLIDSTTGTSLLLGIFLLLIAGYCIIVFIKNIFYTFTDQRMHHIKLITSCLFFIVSALVSSNSLNTCFTNISAYSTENIESFNTTITSYGLDSLDIDWTNFTLGDYIDISGVIKDQLIGGVEQTVSESVSDTQTETTSE